jgi:AcrR family transcriptional regulator
MRSGPEPSGPARPSLSRQRVLSAAIDLADRCGIESLAMRKLAKELGVEAMSLYNHVANKTDLIEGMVDSVVSEIDLPAETTDWEAAIRRCATSAHSVFLEHPWACGLVMAPGSSPSGHGARIRYMEWLLRTLSSAGLSPDLTYSAYHALDSHILGFTLWQLGHGPSASENSDRVATIIGQLEASGDFPYLTRHIRQHLASPAGDDTSEFRFGLDLILEGLKRASRRASRSAG